MTSQSSQQFETYVPVYDTVPENWEEARGAIVEQLKRLANGVNVRENALFIDSEILTGGQFIPTVAMSGPSSSTSEQFRSILRKVIDVSPLVAGANSFAHGITIDANFSLIDLWVAATNSGTLTGQVITGNDVTYDATNVKINSPGAFDRAWAFFEYIQEI